MAEKLSTREETTLLGLMEEYLRTMEPVGSKVLALNSEEGVSSATIRNTLKRLEDKGFLRKAHASSGRIPTDLALRHMVRQIVDESPGKIDPSPEEVGRLASSESFAAVARQLSTMLANSAHMVGFAATPPLDSVRMKRCELVPVGKRRVLFVVVSTSGQVREKTLWSDEPYGARELAWFRDYLNETFAGRTIAEIRRKLRFLVDVERVRYDDKILRAAALVSPYFLDCRRGRDIFWDGAAWLFDYAEFQKNMESIKRLLVSLEKKTGLLALLDGLVREKCDLKIVLGKEWPDDRVQNLAMVVAPFGGTDTGVGVLGVIGPKALRYETAIPVVLQASRLATLAASRPGSPMGPMGGTSP